MSEPLISVLMPVFNGAAHVGAAVRDVLMQTHTALELVLVDDGSTDATAEAARGAAVGDSRLRVLTRPHGGIVPALNAGLAACRGDYVARMDADDRMPPQRLERQLAWLRAHGEAALIGALAEPLPRKGRIAADVRTYHDWMNGLRTEAEIRHALFRESPLPHPTFFARRETFTRLGGYHDAPWPEDYDLLLRARAAGVPLGKVPEVLVRRADGPGRLTRTDARYKRKAMFQAKLHHLLRGPWLRGRAGVVIGGSGTSGRVVAEHLRAAGIALRAFLDNKTGPPTRRVMGVPAFGYSEEIPPDFFAAHAGAFYLACIGQEEGRRVLLRQFAQGTLEEDRDFLVLI